MSALGELETLILLAVLRLGDGAYGVSVRDEMEERAGRRLSRGAVYTALKRLEAKGYLRGSLGEPVPVRGGRARRYLELTDEGLVAVRRATAQMDRMREGLDALLIDGPT